MKSVACLTLLLFAAQVAADETKIGWRGEGRGGAVAAGRPEAVAAGLGVLRDGGNAADAAAATLLALAVTDYGLFAIGGEVPLLIYDAKQGKVQALSGLGGAPLDEAAIKWFYENGIPATGSMKSAPVPGAVDLCVTTLQRYGTISFQRAVRPTLALLDQKKKPWHARLAVTLRKLVAAERESSGDRVAKLQAARDVFYVGEVADELEAWYIKTGSFLRKRDLAAHRTRIEDPVSVNYRGYTVYKCGPWTQGPYLCQSLKLLEGFGLKEMGHLSVASIHTITECLKLGFADRDEYYGDPRFAKVPLDILLSDKYASLRRKLVDGERASMERRPGDPYNMRPLLKQAKGDDARDGIPIQDTTTCVVADRWGNVVAATPSCNLVGNKPGPSGVTQGNRLRSLNTTPNHPNRIQPGKRPRITLTPTLVLKDGKPVVAISVAGGDLQDQTTLNVLLNHIEYGMLPADAVRAARFNTSHHQNSFNPNPHREKAIVGLGKLRLNASVDELVRKELATRGHKISTTKGAIGYPVMIYIDQKSGMLYAAGDPDAKRHAAALKE